MQRVPTSQQIRQGFIDYFVQRHAHRYVPSSPVVPHDDPTLLFTNAGMNQFKDVFLGAGTRDYTRAVNTQKCIRAGGKHNDLEDVGKDTYHHTFFEMLGNWSFGDYFKAEAIAWAWDLLTRVWGVDKSRLHATVFGGDPAEGLEPDTEAADLWRSVTDIDPSHIHFGSKKDNFWEMAETGPCGPCSEIHIDRTPDRSGGGLVNAGDPRVIEIWNLVFIQFNRDAAGKLTPLPAKHVDTGMGFERVCAVLQGKGSNYDTDVFTPIFAAIREVTGARPYGGALDDRVDIAYRVVADHIRCLTFALTDGAVPSNEGRGYVLRRILRRAARHGRQTLGTGRPFLWRLAPTVVDLMGGVFPELRVNPQRVVELIREEEESFGRTLDRGIELFNQAADRGGSRIAAEDAFKLHDTYGFPLDLTQVMAQERGLTVDVEGFARLMEEARQKARGVAGQVDPGQILIDILQREQPPATEFLGYEQTEASVQTFCLLYKLTDGGWEPIRRACVGDRVIVVVGRTPFYAEAGGQVGDTGDIRGPGDAVVRIVDTRKAGEVHFHFGTVEKGVFEACPPSRETPGVQLTLRVDPERRQRIMANHTGTHLVNRALRAVLGEHVQQKGSLVDGEKLRFDFSHPTALEEEQVSRVEELVNTDIGADLPVYADCAPQEQALKIRGLRAVFGEKYPSRVRVVSIGVPLSDLLADPTNARWYGYSIEFCGGTHLAKTGDAEGLVIVAEEAIAKGVRRVTALTGRAAHQAAARGELLLSRVQGLSARQPDQLADALSELNDAIARQQLPLQARAQLREGIARLQAAVKQHEKSCGKRLAEQVVEVARKLAEEAQGNLIVAAVEGADAGGLRTAMDTIRKKQPEAALLLGAASEGKVNFLAAVPPALIARGLKAGDWVREVAKVAGGGGGGRPDMAQAGGKDPGKLHEALEVGRRYAQSQLEAYPAARPQ
jgi:alanyl-tRNA synthetase